MQFLGAVKCDVAQLSAATAMNPDHYTRMKSNWLTDAKTRILLGQHQVPRTGRIWKRVWRNRYGRLGEGGELVGAVQWRYTRNFLLPCVDFANSLIYCIFRAVRSTLILRRFPCGRGFNGKLVERGSSDCSLLNPACREK